MNYVLTPEQMATADKSAAYDLHIPGIVLMENAAHAVLKEIRQDFPPDSRNQPRLTATCTSSGYVTASRSV